MRKLLDKELIIKLTVAEAIVLNNFIERFDNFNIQNISDDEKRALWNLQCLLEKELVEPSITDYHKTLAEAKKHLNSE